MSRTIALSGMMGAGKTTVGAHVARRLGRRLVDTDTEIEQHLERPVAEIVGDVGIDGFRLFEHQVIRQVLRHDDLVVALGGGAVLDDRNVSELLLTGVVVHLDVPAAVLLERLTDPRGAGPSIGPTSENDNPRANPQPKPEPESLLEGQTASGEVARRPLLGADPAADLARIHAERDARYREVADVVIDGSPSPGEVADEVLAWARNAGDVLTPSEHEVTM